MWNYAHAKSMQGLFWPDETLDTDSLGLRYGTINNKMYTGITTEHGKKIVLRGKSASSHSEATVLFIEAVLDTGARYQSKFLKEMEEMVEARARLHPAEASNGDQPNA